VNLARLFRRAAARQQARQLRRKTGTARRVVADTDAMLARRTPHPRRNAK
jgi:hypothetical protein